MLDCWANNIDSTAFFRYSIVESNRSLFWGDEMRLDCSEMCEYYLGAFIYIFDVGPIFKFIMMSQPAWSK